MAHCKYDLELSTDELLGMTWLAETLVAILGKGPSHCSFHRATHAASALATMKMHCTRVHVSAHALMKELAGTKGDVKLLETRLASLEAALTAGNPPEEVE